MSTSVTIITQNQQMREIISRLNRVIDTDSSILLIGETGVGKEIFAEYIHHSSNRSLRPFMKIGLSAMPSELMESELFGHEKGSFTSAINHKKGLFELADTGSIFLDDIDDTPLNIQTKLLRVLESRELMRVGGGTSIPIDVRLICASKVDLKEMVKRGTFRSDLFYRINVVPFDIPPLRERKDDISILAQHFIRRFSGGRNLSISNEALDALVNYDWPGNVRELRNIIQRATIFSGDVIEPLDFPREISKINPVDILLKACNNCYLNGGLSLPDLLQCVEHHFIEEALKKSKGNQSDAAKILGLSLSTFRDKMKKFS